MYEVKRRIKLYSGFVFILALLGFSILLNWPGGAKIQIKDKVLWDYDPNVKQGLDLQGGARVTYKANTEEVEDRENIDEAMNSLVLNIENRVNAFGVSEASVQKVLTSDEHRIVVEMPGVSDANEVMALIGKTAELKFKLVSEEGGFIETDLTGKDLKLAQADFNQETGKPEIRIEFKGEGVDKFAKITEENVGKTLITFLDDEVIQSANINEKIPNGSGVINGIEDIASAKETAKLLNAGALPMSIEPIEQREVGATLGKESVDKSLYAGVIGIIFVSLFMIVYYRFQGLLSTIGLFVYLSFMLVLIKFFGITMTMGGIAGLILSIGMTMETDVLVFERIREELRNGHDFYFAVNKGFKNAWPSIRDSSAVSTIIAALLYTAGGTIRGFAVVLILGIIIGLATTFIGTKTFLQVAIRYKYIQNYSFFKVKKEEVEA